MNEGRYTIYPLGEGDLLVAANICASAMNDNPVHIQVFGASSVLRQHRLKRFFPGLLIYIYRKGYLYGTFDDGAMVGVLGLLPPSNCKPSPGEFLRLMPTLLTSNSPTGLLRLAAWLATWARLDPPTPHWHIGPLAVLPSWQHRGIGSQLIEYILHKHSGERLYLETDKLTNVGFYERFGFSAIATVSVLATPTWLMEGRG